MPFFRLSTIVEARDYEDLEDRYTGYTLDPDFDDFTIVEVSPISEAIIYSMHKEEE